MKKISYFLIMLIAILGCEEDSDSGYPPYTAPTDQPQPTDVGSSGAGFDTLPIQDTWTAAADTRSDLDTSSPSGCTFSTDPPIPDICVGNQICVIEEFGANGQCESAFSRRYLLYVGAVEVPNRNADGECWDLGCGAPDLFAEVYIDDLLVLRTEQIDNMHAVRLFETVEYAYFSMGSVLQVYLFDQDDLSGNEFIAGCELNPVEASHLRARGLLCRAPSGASFVFGFIAQ